VFIGDNREFGGLKPTFSAQVASGLGMMIGSMGFAGLCILELLSGNKILGLLREGAFSSDVTDYRWTDLDPRVRY
jgi:hypothetical protein